MTIGTICLRTLGAAGILATVLADLASAQTPAPLKIGVLTDLSGPYSDSGGPGSVLAAQMAVADFGGTLGGTLKGRKIEIISGDTLNKPDVASGVARRWFDTEGVAAVVDLPVTPVAFAVHALAKQSNKNVLITAAATSDLTSKMCMPQSVHWADDTHALAAGTAKELVANGAKSWQFIAVDIAFGAALVKEASDVVTASGGTVTGTVRHPVGATDYSSLLLQAQTSKAQMIGLASVGGDLVNVIKQSKEFAIGADGSQSLVAFLVYITDIHALGLDVAQNLVVTSSFYWDQNDQSRAFAKRFFDTRKAMPTKNQAAVYASVMHYLRAVDAAGTDEAVAVGKKMRELPVTYFGRPSSVRSDGRVVFDLDVYRVKKKADQKAPWDYYTPVRKIPAAEAFLPVNAQACGG
jgi:branched-chain amino acid transport system substrate-binding protein